MCNIMFHKSTLYYEKKTRRPTSSSVPDDENCSESESDQEHEPRGSALRQQSTTAAIAVQKTKTRNLKSNLGVTTRLEERNGKNKTNGRKRKRRKRKVHQKRKVPWNGKIRRNRKVKNVWKCGEVQELEIEKLYRDQRRKTE